MSTVRFRTVVLSCLGVLVGPDGSAAFAQIVGGEFESTHSDTVPRMFHAGGMLHNGLVMVSGGLGLQIFPPSLFSRNQIAFYDPGADTFSSQFTPLGGGGAVTPTLLTARSGHTQTTLADGRVLIAGGNVGASGTSPGSPTATVEIFDPQTGVVSAAASMNTARAMHSATLLPDGRVVIAGGATWQIFQPGPDTWSTNYSLAKSRTAHAAVLLPDFGGTPGDDRVLLIGGGGTGQNTLELLDPATATTMLLSSTLAIGVDDVAAVRLSDGRVFIVGGQNLSTGDTIGDTYLLDPVTESLSPGPAVPNRPGGIADHQIVRFGSRVVIFGGEQQLSGVDTILDYIAIFDSQLDQWIADGTMLHPHDDFAAVALGGCSVLLVGGGVPLLGQEAPSANCERFTLALPGDLNGDGVVDLTDLGILLANYGTGTTPEEGDLDGNGDVDLTDLGMLLASYASSC